jgi:hypothetical protein
MTPEQVEEYVWRSVKTVAITLGYRAQTGGREYETGRPIGSWTMPEPARAPICIGTGVSNPVIIRPNRADRHFVERQGDGIMDIFFN